MYSVRSSYSLQNFPIEAHTNVRIFILAVPPAEKLYGLHSMGILEGHITRTLYILEFHFCGIRSITPLRILISMPQSQCFHSYCKEQKLG